MAKQVRTATRNTVSGALRSYIHLQNRGTVDDGFGNMVPGGRFTTQFSVYANFRPLLRGSATGVEDVFASRIEGNQPFIVTVRKSSQFDNVTTAWRMVDARSSKYSNWVLGTGYWLDSGTWLDTPNWEYSNQYLKYYNIKSPPSDDTNGDMWLEFIAVLDEQS